MSDKDLKIKIQAFFKASLEAKDFVLKHARQPERMLSGLRQGIETQIGTGHLDGQYTLNVYWSFMTVLDEGVSMDVCKRIDKLSDQRKSWFKRLTVQFARQQRWFSRKNGDIESDFSKVQELILHAAIPFLDRYDTIEKILKAHANKEINAVDAFGEDVAGSTFTKATVMHSRGIWFVRCFILMKWLNTIPTNLMIGFSVENWRRLIRLRFCGLTELKS
jgi:hypothetical protein